MVQPIKLNQLALEVQYEKILTTSAHIDIYVIDIEVSKRAAKLRADYNLKTPDAIQIATGIENNADFFLTIDLDLKRLTEIKILTMEEL